MTLEVIPFQFDCAMSLSIRLRTVIPHESGNPSSLAPQNMVTSQWIGITWIMTTQTTAIQRYRRPRGQYPRRQESDSRPKPLPEYLEAHEVDALLRAAPNARARLLFLVQWRAGLRVSEALALEVRDLSLDSGLPTIHVRQGKGAKPRIVPVHPELHSALASSLQFGNIVQGDRLFSASRSTADRWIRAAKAKAAGAIPTDRRISSHTLRHSYARHLLVNGIPINYLSRWLGHSSIQTTLIYLELVPDPTGSLVAVP